MSIRPFYLVLIIPASVWIGFYIGGLGNYLTIIVVFGMVPLLDALLGLDTSNPTDGTIRKMSANRQFRRLTWICGMIQIATVTWGIFVFTSTPLTVLEQLGLILSVGTCSGGMGIVVSHELIHRVDNRFEPLLGRILLASVLYLHWAVEHVAGHHRRVATETDPATARKGESYFAFLPRTVIGGFQSAWGIEIRRLKRRGKPSLSTGNRIIRYGAMQLLLIILVTAAFGFKGVLFYLAQSVVAVCLLELVNYIEHYGLMRRKLDKSNYEPVQPVHSWNASYRLTNYLLFNLQRHSDHHQRPGRRYQMLRHFDESPQLPLGYATMVILALIPPLWFKVMNHRLPEYGSEPLLSRTS